jgi:hypothetical protein
MRKLLDWTKERLSQADLVAVGVNLVVGVLLLGGIIGSFYAHGTAPATAPRPDAAAVAQPILDPPTDNSTLPSDTPLASEDPAPEPSGDGDGHHHHK